MQLEAIRIVADWLGNPSSSTSVNYYLDTVELDAGDSRPENVTVYDATRHGWVARRRLSREGSNVDFPALAVVAPSTSGDGTVYDAVMRKGTIEVAVVYVDQDHESASGAAAGLYTMRAVRRSLNQLNLNANDSSRRRNDIYLVNWLTFSEASAEMQFNDAVVVAPTLVTTWTIRDDAPTAASS